MKRWILGFLLSTILAHAAAPRLDYDPTLLLPDGSESLVLEECPVPRGFLEPLEAKGWASDCILAHGDPLVLERALVLALEKAGYQRLVREEQRLSEQGRFVLERWRGAERELFIQYFFFSAQGVVVYLISHPPHR